VKHVVQLTPTPIPFFNINVTNCTAFTTLLPGFNPNTSGPLPGFTPNETNCTALSYQPCYYKPHSNGKMVSPSASCVETGWVIATGKYSSIMVDPRTGQPWEWSVNATTRRAVRRVSDGTMFHGMLSDGQRGRL
jgi:hypothetical protein